MRDLYLLGGLPWWVAAVIALAAVALLAHQFFTLRQRLGVYQSALLTLLRGAVYALLVFFLFGPALIEQRVTKLRRPLTVLIDSSASMAFPLSAGDAVDGRPSKSRLDAVKEKLLAGSDPAIQRLGREYDLKLFKFGADLEPIAPSSIAQLAARDQGTRLLDLVEQAARQNSGQAGILVFSDGINNGEKQELDGAAGLPVPVFTVGAGDERGFTDLRIVEVRAPEFGFRGREFKVDVVVQSHGLNGRSVPLYFNRGRNLITSRTITITSELFEQTVTLGFTPKEIGSHHFTVSLPQQPGEHIAQNNQKEFKVDVQRDKIRVLTLSGSPAWNYRFLRMALKQDPLIDLVSFVFLRTPTDSVDVPDNQLSLIPFPIDDIFLEELKNFDVLILDDFSHRSYFNPVYLEKVRDFVRDGGGLAMLGGARSFDSGGYAESALKEVLPVELDGQGSYQMPGEIRAALTPAGKAHPITRLLPDPRANEAAWSRLPPLRGMNRVHRARGETLVIATGNGVGTGTPLLTVGRFGKGRTLALMSDDIWRWNFIAVGERDTPQNHLKFIRQTVRWLAQEPSFEQVQIRRLPVARPGERVIIKVRVLKDDFTPARDAAVQLRVVAPEGDAKPLAPRPGSEEGDYQAEFIPVRQGLHHIEAEATLGGKPLGKDRSSFSVALSFAETDDGRPRTALLKRVAEVSRGEYFPLEQWNDKAIERIKERLESHAPSEIIERRQIRLWSTIWTFSVALVLLSAEWWLRRKWGLV
ncbi:MAG TPA: glutamine amidotransferase [Candidatus Eisenbacteria bacterium]|nr:glutamine amidotransferase [Candidatus Eisenbacteria bacterium]